MRKQIETTNNESAAKFEEARRAEREAAIRKVAEIEKERNMFQGEVAKAQQQLTTQTDECRKAVE